MALASNALTTVASLQAYMGRAVPDISQIAIYHDQSVSATACTVAVDTTKISIVITGGANAGTTTYTFAANATITAMVTALDAAAIGLVVRVMGSGSASSDELSAVTAIDCFGSASEQALRGRDDFAYEQAIDATSNWMARFCGRVFASAIYRQAYSGTGHEHIRLIQRPVTEIIRVSINRTEGLKIRCTSSDSHDATVRYDGTSIDLDIIGGTNAGTNAVTTAAKTITTLATEITALTDWTASAGTTAIGTMDGVDLMKAPAVQCLGTENALWVPGESIDDPMVESATGILKRRSSFFQHRGNWAFGGHRPVVSPGRLSDRPVFERGHLNIIVKYVAGESTPIDLEMLANEGAATLLRSGMRDMGLQSETSSGYSYSVVTGALGQNEAWVRKMKPFRSEPPFPEFEDV